MELPTQKSLFKIVGDTAKLPSKHVEITILKKFLLLVGITNLQKLLFDNKILAFIIIPRISLLISFLLL